MRPPLQRSGNLAGLATAAGAASGAVVLALWAILYGLRLTPFPLFDLADVLIRATPGDLATWSIETFGLWAKRLLVIASVLGWIALWGAIGYVSKGGLSRRAAVVLSLILVVPILALVVWSGPDLDAASAIWFTIAFGLTLTVGGLLLGRWSQRIADIERNVDTAGASENWLDQPADIERREFLRHVATVAVFAGVGSLTGWFLRNSDIRAAQTGAGRPLDTLRGDLETSTPTTGTEFPTPIPATEPANTFDAPVGVRPLITSNADFYEIDINTRDPNIQEDGWALRVHGLVERELTLSYSDLLTLPAVDEYGTLMCISYRYGSGLISTTRWTGVRLRDILERAGIRDGAVDVICRGGGGYSDSIPLSKALDVTTLAAYGMNGEALPRSHGFPCRLYVPNIYGMKNVKWLREIELVDHDYQGFWQERGWSDVAVVNTISMIDVPRGTASIDVAGMLPVGGIAFAGSRGIQSVQLKIDDGPWLDAELEPNEPSLIWQRWRYDWQAEPGTHTLTVRAVDGTGTPQVVAEADPHPDGMTGLHSVTVTIG